MVRKNWLTTAAALVVVTTASAALATTGTTAAPTSTKFYLHSDGCGNGQTYFLDSTRTGMGDTAAGCGTIGGVPVDEAAYQAGAPLSADYATTETDKKLPFTLDGTHDVTGVITTESWTGTGGVGTVQADIDVTAVTADGDGIDLGSTTVSTQALPTAKTYQMPFTLPADAANDGLQITALDVTLTVHGLNENAGVTSYSGQSYLTVPIQPAAATTG